MGSGEHIDPCPHVEPWTFQRVWDCMVGTCCEAPCLDLAFCLLTSSYGGSPAPEGGGRVSDGRFCKFFLYRGLWEGDFWNIYNMAKVSRNHVGYRGAQRKVQHHTFLNLFYFLSKYGLKSVCRLQRLVSLWIFCCLLGLKLNILAIANCIGFSTKKFDSCWK